MEKKLVITMNQIDGSIDYTSDGEVSYAESLGMLEYAKMMIYREWNEELD